MDRRGHGGVVDKAHHALTTLFDKECGAGGDAIVADQVGGALVGIDLVLEVVDVHLVVVNGVSSDWVRNGPRTSQHLDDQTPAECLHGRGLDGRDGKRELVKPCVGQTFPVLGQDDRDG